MSRNTTTKSEDAQRVGQRTRAGEWTNSALRWIAVAEREAPLSRKCCMSSNGPHAAGLPRNGPRCVEVGDREETVAIFPSGSPDNTFPAGAVPEMSVNGTKRLSLGDICT